LYHILYTNKMQSVLYFTGGNPFTPVCGGGSLYGRLVPAF
jgi:hypothetical protein